MPNNGFSLKKLLKKKEADGRQPLFFDNPKTNLTYEKNLYIV
jgi:hypothetical protein